MLAEHLLLVAWNSERGRPPLGKKDALRTGLCGALVSELTLRKAVAVVEGRAVVVDAGPSGDDLLDEVLRVLAEDGTRGRSLKRQLKAVRRAEADVVGRIARRLVDAGVLRQTDSRVAGIFPATRYPVVALDAPDRVREEVRAWLGDASGAAPDPRTPCLVALLRACGLLGTVTDGLRERRHASARARAAMKDDPVAGAVKAIVDEVYAVTAGAAVVVFGV
jgi:hypothetical protein